MISETELKNTIQKAHRADQLLNDPLIQEFIANVKHDLLKDFQSTKLDSEVARLDVWQRSQILNSFLDQFKKTIKEGKTAQSLLERMKTKLRNVI